MSEEGSEQQEEIKEIPEEPGKKIFISHINSYVGRVLFSQMDNRDKCKDVEFAGNKFCGTLLQSTNSVFATDQSCPDGVEKTVQMSRSREFRDSVLESDTIVYDLMTNSFEEVDYVIKTLKTAKLKSKKTLIILSSVMTWVNTPAKVQKEGEEQEVGEDGAEGEEGQEEASEAESEAKEPELDSKGEEIPPPPKVLPFKESDYHMRVPHENFISHKNLETLALSAPKAQPFLNVHILCCGIRYGLGEAMFFEHFKHAWIQKPNSIPVVGKGDNLVPTIHINDIGGCVQRICEGKVSKEFIFAIDKTSKPTQKRLAQAISNGVGTGKIRYHENKEIPDSIFWKQMLTIDLKMRTSDVFKDYDAPEESELTPEQEAALKFPWHCQKGIIDNVKKLNEEFNKVRNLNPVKIIITGPPASGKTFYAEQVSHYYNIPRIHVKQLSDKAFELSNVGEEEEQDELGAAIKAKIDELKDAEVEKINEQNEKDGIEDPPEIDRDSLKVRVPDEFLFQLLKQRLMENDCRNRGYILDGFPRTYKDAQNIFLKQVPKYDEEGELIVEEEPELEEGEEKSWDGYIVNDQLAPTSCIVMKQSREFLLDRVKNLPEKTVAGTHYTMDDTKRRCIAYENFNMSKVAEPSVHDFFKENTMQVFPKDCSLNQVTVMHSFKIYIERIETPNNFQYHDETVETKRRIMVDLNQEIAKKMEALKAVMEEGVERQIKAQKEKHVKTRMQKIREDQKEDLDQKSQPIRQYLQDNLVPILTDGLIETCKMQPEDPVDALAEYLFKRSLDVPYPDPTSYIE